jgi:hypothetical protein
MTAYLLHNTLKIVLPIAEWIFIYLFILIHNYCTNAVDLALPDALTHRANIPIADNILQHKNTKNNSEDKRAII